jgi:hypothetical protein
VRSSPTRRKGTSAEAEIPEAEPSCLACLEASDSFKGPIPQIGRVCGDEPLAGLIEARHPAVEGANQLSQVFDHSTSLRTRAALTRKHGGLI